jgi:hypothetical protein
MSFTTVTSIFASYSDFRSWFCRKFQVSADEISFETIAAGVHQGAPFPASDPIPASNEIKFIVSVVRPHGNVRYVVHMVKDSSFTSMTFTPLA